MKKSLLVFFAFFLIGAGSAHALSAQDIIISEVMIDGDDEWIELTNMTMQDQTLDLELRGAKSKAIALAQITLAAGASYILGDNLSMLSSQLLGQPGWGLSLTDSASLDLELRSEGVLLDDMKIETGVVKSHDNQKSSFHKVWDGQQWLIEIVSSDFSSGTFSPWLANPGLVVSRNDGENYFWTAGGRQERGQGHIPNSGSQQPIGSGSGVDSPTTPADTPADTPVLSGCLSSPFFIDELYLGEEYAPYIEILVKQDTLGGFVLSGSALGYSLVIPEQERQVGQRYLVTNSLAKFKHSGPFVLVDQLELTSGDLELWSSSGGLLDHVFIWSLDTSHYRADADCGATLVPQASPSPGFDDQFLSYMGQSSSVCPLPPHYPSDPAPSSGNNQSETNSGGASGQVIISLIDFDPPGSDTNNEQIGISSLSGSWDLSGRTLRYDSKTYHFGSGIANVAEQYVRKDNFQFVNSRPVCIELRDSNSLRDRQCYDPSLHSSPYLPQEPVLDYESLSLRILGVNYDPPGDDTNTETVTIQFSSGAQELDLSVLRLRVGTSNKTLTGIISLGQILTIRGNFQMPNSKDTCVALVYKEYKYDEYCYSIQKSLPEQVGDLLSLRPQVDITIEEVVYDVPGSDRDNEIIRLRLLSPESLDLKGFSIRFNGKSRALHGKLVSQQSNAIKGDYQLPNSQATCLELVYLDHVYDRFCYDPAMSIETGSHDVLTGTLLSGVMFESLLYDPPGSDKGNEQITITIKYPILLAHPLYLKRDGKKKKLSDKLSLSGSMTFVGDYQLPNSKATCVELVSHHQVLDRYCYDPHQKEVILSGELELSDRSQLQLYWVLPNPQGKDIINDNELVALHWGGDQEITLPAGVKLMIDTTNYSLAGKIVQPGETIFPLSKSLPNSPRCLRLVINEHLADELCYPQAKEATRYYHPRRGRGPHTIPDALIQALDFQSGSLAKLILKHIDKKTCLTYDKVVIRCMTAQSSPSAKKDKKLLSLTNSYINHINTLIANNQLSPTTLRPRRQTFLQLSQAIKSGKLDTITLQGREVAVQDLERYVSLVKEQGPAEYLVDQLGVALFGQEDMKRYYQQVYH